MHTHIHTQNKLASIGTIGLLFLAGIAGMVFLLPGAHAASRATVTLATISPLSSTVGGPTELTGVTAGTVGSSLDIIGTGFASNAAISVSTTVGTSTVFWFPTASQNNCAGAFASTSGGVNGVDSLANAASPTGCVTTTAVGNFESVFTVPALPGGSETIKISDGTNTVSQAFTITPKTTFTAGGTSFGFPEQNIGSGTFTATGFGASETVTFTTTAFTAASLGTAQCTTNSFGTCASPYVAGALVVAETTGGAKSITATGATSGLSASTTYTVNPWVAFYNSQTGTVTTTFSFLGTAPTSLLIEGHGFQAGTIAANSVTVGGVATTHASVTVSSTGAFGGAGAMLVVSPTANVPFGPAPVVIQGTTFNYASGNIALGAGVWGGVLISSIQGSESSTGITSLDSSSYKPGESTAASTTSPAPLKSQVGIFGYGFITPTAQPNNGGTVSITTPSGVTWSVAPAFYAGNGGTAGASGAAKPDSNGAFFGIAQLGDTPWSTTGAPTVAASYSPVFSQGTAGTTGPANVISPSFGITPWDTISSSTVDYTTNNFNVIGHGFGPTDVLTVTIGGAAVVSGGTCTVASTGTCTTANAVVPDLAAGPQTVVLTGSISGASVSTTSGTTYDPNIKAGTSTSLNVVSGPAGTTTILRTGTNYGVHGLYANTQYNIVWNAGTNLPGAAGTVLGTFTSTATGGIPVPGVQVTVPADTSGIHILDLQRVSTPGTSMMFSNNLQGDYTDSDAGLTGTYYTNFGDVLFYEQTTLTGTPTVANVGGSVTVTGTGLAANTLYDLGLGMAGVGTGTVPSTCALTGAGTPANPPTSIAGSFTSTSSGSVPAATSVSVTDMPTFAGLEQGTLYCVFAQTGPTFGSTSSVGVAQFELQASESANMTAAPIGHNIVLNAHGLAASTGYNVLFAPFTLLNGNVAGTVVGAILSNVNGAGSGTFSVPGTIQTANGAQAVVSGQNYVVELQPTGKTYAAVASPISITVGSTSSTTCNTTNCFTATAPTTTTLNNQQTVETMYTNTSNAPATAIVYAVVHNSAGQTVSYSTATITVAAGATATAYNVLYGLPPGTYSVTLFATSTSGTSISGTTTTSVTVP
jgi:hypothetical protein